MASTLTYSAAPGHERRLIWRAQFLCAMGQGMGAILIAWILVRDNHGALAIGICLAAGLLPVALGAAHAGRRAERQSRRNLLVGAQATLALIALALVVTPEPPLALVIAGALGCGLARLIFDAACISVLHHLVAEERLGTAARDLTGHFHAGHLCGLGLAVVGVSWPGTSAMLTVCASIFAAGALTSTRHHRDIDLRPSLRPSLDAALITSRSIMWAERPLRSLTLATLITSMVAGGAGALILPYLRIDLRLGDQSRPVVLAGLAGLGITLLIVPRVVGRMPWRSALVVALLAHPLALVLLGVADGRLVASLGYGVLIGAGALVGIIVNHNRAGRVHGDLRVPVGLAGGALNAWAAAIGAVAMGVAAGPLGESQAYLALAVFTVIAGLAAVAALRPAPPWAVRPS